MGKGDKKSKRGKITIGTFGVRRLRKKSVKTATIAVEAKKEIVKTVLVDETAAIAVETVAEPKVEKEKTETKAAKPAKEKKEAKTVKTEKQAKEPKAKKEKKAE
jgi:30S ribosomal protein S31